MLMVFRRDMTWRFVGFHWKLVILILGRAPGFHLAQNQQHSDVDLLAYFCGQDTKLFCNEYEA